MLMSKTVWPGIYKRISNLFLVALAIAVCSGCRTSQSNGNIRPFTFGKDTFSYANELVWEYHFADDGKWTAERREPKPDYTLHCFVVSRSAKQFFLNAKFAPEKPRTTEKEYRKLIQRVVDSSPRRAREDKVVIPGFADLHDFSMEYEYLLKENCGGAWQSYLQRGHWRMVMPFSRGNQQAVAEKLVDRTEANWAPVIHVVSFPDLRINHAVLLFGVKETPDEILFDVYDPNKPKAATTLTYNRKDRTFYFPGNDYFSGGNVNVYEIYRSALY